MANDSKGKKIRFIRVRGKVVPIKDDNYNGGRDAGHPGARDFRDQAKETRKRVRRGEQVTRATALGSAAAFALGKRGSKMRSRGLKGLAIAALFGLGVAAERHLEKRQMRNARRLDRAGAVASGKTSVGY